MSAWKATNKQILVMVFIPVYQLKREWIRHAPWNTDRSFVSSDKTLNNTRSISGGRELLP